MIEGWHRGKGIDFAINTSDNGTMSIAVLLQVTDGDPSGDGGSIITWYGYCTDAAIDNTVAALRLMGWTGNDLSEFESSEIISVDTLIPNEVSFPINHEEYQGKIVSKVGKICKASDGKVAVKNRVEGRAAKDFGARFRAACAANPASGGVAPKQPAPKPRPALAKPQSTDPPRGSDDEYPF